jgi:hypothetical protein
LGCSGPRAAKVFVFVAALAALTGGWTLLGAPAPPAAAARPPAVARPLSAQLGGGYWGAPTAGYWVVAADGTAYNFASAFYGDGRSLPLAAPLVGAAADADGSGYWLVGADGGVLSFGSAGFYGSAVPFHPAAPIVGMAAAPDGKGYWLVGADGGVFSFGSAGFYGSAVPYHPLAPIVGMAANPDGSGYWLVGADGGVFSFGSAGFYGSAVPYQPLAPMVGLAAAPNGGGYWLVGRDGGVFSFGAVPFLGSAAGMGATAPVVGIAATGGAHLLPPSASGYDISQFQCPAYAGESPPPPPYAFGVTEVSGGAIDQAQPPGCYAEEAAWAGPNQLAYIFMDPPPAGTTDYYGYGYSWAQHWVAVAAAAGTHPLMWFLDVEFAGGWATDSGSQYDNSQEILGALEGLRAVGAVPGVYSTHLQWRQITGNLLSLPGLPIWMAGASDQTQALAFCSGEYSLFNGDYKAFAGGTVLMSQVAGGTYDVDYSCP